MIRTTWLASLGVLLSACSSSAGPDDHHGSLTGRQLLVTNTTCEPGPCQPVRVLGFPGDHPPVPDTNAFRFEIGIVTTASACLTIAPHAEFLIIGQHENGSEDTTRYEWFDDQPMQIGGVSLDTPFMGQLPSTHLFIPTSAAAWSVRLPDTSDAASAADCSHTD